MESPQITVALVLLYPLLAICSRKASIYPIFEIWNV